MDTALAKLRPFNLIAALLHLASLAATLILANDAALPVNATYMNGPPGTATTTSTPVPLTVYNPHTHIVNCDLNGTCYN